MLCGGQHATSWNCQKTAKWLKLQGWYVAQARGETAYPFDNTRCFVVPSWFQIQDAIMLQEFEVDRLQNLCVWACHWICWSVATRDSKTSNLAVAGRHVWQVLLKSPGRCQSPPTKQERLHAPTSKSATATPTSKVASQESRILMATATAAIWSCNKTILLSAQRWCDRGGVSNNLCCEVCKQVFL